MADWPAYRPLELYAGGVISTALLMGGLSGSVAFLSTAWPSANLAIFIPFTLGAPVTVYKMVAGAGATAGSNNFDVGIYDAAGNKLVSSGATAKGNSVEHIIDIADTVIGPGTYYLAMSADGTGNYAMMTPSGTSPVPLQKTRLFGVMAMATAYTLPATATFAAATLAPLPAIAAYMRPY